MAKRVDRRVQRTKELLRRALFSLIKENGYEALSVQDIIDRANIGRATFYAHFDNKEDLLLSGFDVLRASLRDRQLDALSDAQSKDERVLAFAYDLITHIEEHRDLFRAMVGKRSGAVVQNMILKLVVDLVRNEIRTLSVKTDDHSTTAEANAEFIASGLFGMLMWWLTGRTRLSAEEFNSLFRRFAIPAAKAALQR